MFTTLGLIVAVVMFITQLIKKRIASAFRWLVFSIIGGFVLDLLALFVLGITLFNH